MTTQAVHILYLNSYGFCNKEQHAREGHASQPSRCAVWVYDSKTPKGQAVCRRRGVKNLSAETHYYSLDTLGGPDPSPEQEISRLEGKAAPVIKDLQPGRVLEPEERVWLALFAAHMKFRVPDYRSSAAERARTNAPRIKRDAFPDPQTLAEDLRKAGHDFAEDKEAVERIFEEVHSEDYVIELTKNQHSLKRPAQLFPKSRYFLA